jgi:hypothetical protein
MKIFQGSGELKEPGFGLISSNCRGWTFSILLCRYEAQWEQWQVKTFPAQRFLCSLRVEGRGVKIKSPSQRCPNIPGGDCVPLCSHSSPGWPYLKTCHLAPAWPVGSTTCRCRIEFICLFYHCIPRTYPGTGKGSINIVGMHKGTHEREKCLSYHWSVHSRLAVPSTQEVCHVQVHTNQA